MPLIQLKKVSIAFGTHALLDEAELQLDKGERVGLLGRNGEGKSTLLKLLINEIHADDGEIWRAPELKIAYLHQAPELDPAATVYDTVTGALGEVGQSLTRYHELSLSLDAQDDKVLQEMGRLQHYLDTHEGWQLQQRVEAVISRLQLPTDARIDSLSGGWIRRVVLARALVIEPDVLLLDEPTNHLDLESISWLEEQLLNYKGCIMFVTHDRSFLQKLATRIVDLDRGKLVSWPGNYADYQRRKAAALEEEENQNALFDKKLAQEESWIRQGIKARRTRNEGRVRALKKLRVERSQRRNQQGVTKLSLQSAENSGKRVISAENICFSYVENLIVKNFSVTIQRGDKIGLLGPNGAGKTTLLRLLLQQLQPDSGTVTLGTKLQVAYFDQLREQLDPEQSVADSVADGNEYLDLAGGKRHVMSYLGDFLFAPARARSPVKSLSGGEKSRLLLARLFTRPANLIIMDEPTNDLDLETLELLEDKLVSFPGTLILVSHDRVFLDDVVTSVIAYEGQGVFNEYVGGYTDWQQHVQQREGVKKAAKTETKKPQQAKPKKLSYKDQRELQQLPALIEQMEAEHEVLQTQINAAEFYRQDQETIAATLTQFEGLEKQMEQAYLRWDELEAQQ